MTETCYACDRVLGHDPKTVLTSDKQRQFVGRECWAMVLHALYGGYQPPKGGPRLFVDGPCASCGGTDADPLDCAMDCDDPRPWTEAARAKNQMNWR